MGTPKALARRIADLSVQAPQDFDPEEDAPLQHSEEGSDSEESEDDLAGTEHYAKVSKSKLRKPAEIALGPEYSGSRVSRKALLQFDESNEDNSAESSDNEAENLEENFADPDDVDVNMDDEDGEIDSDEALGESDEEKFKNFTFRGSGNPRQTNGAKKRPTASDFMRSDDESDDSKEGDQGIGNGDGSAAETDEDVLDVDEQHLDESEEDDEDSPEESEDAEQDLEHQDSEQSEDDEDDEDGEFGSDDSKSDEKSRRAELRKIMGEEQKSVIATISQAAKADAEKGNAVKLQRKAFDSLLSVRMVLQKALIATNSMAADQEKNQEAGKEPYEAAEAAAMRLWNTLDSLRQDLSKSQSTEKSGKKRKRQILITTPSSEIWDRMQNHEVATINTRQSTLEKWSAKVRGTTALPLTRKLNPTAGLQSITSVLQDHLASSEPLVKRTKVPRSCAPIQRDLKITEDPNIYDDGNFYQMLLKELVDQRRVESLTAPMADGNKTIQWAAVKEAKTRKNVDTKASKGRKMRFTVHEKLQNFMAPEDRGSWEPEAIDRFFGTLLGQKMTLGEEDRDDEMDDGIPHEDEGLMLFRS